MGMQSEKGLYPYISGAAKIAIACLSGMFLVALIVATGHFLTDPTDNRQKPPESIRSSSVYIAGDYIDNAPSWYEGKKPWWPVGREHPVDILSLLRAFENNRASAKEESNIDLVARGEQLISQTLKQYRIDPIYNAPRVVGPRMVIWLPQEAWNGYSPEQKASIEAYMQSKYKNWGIGVGRVSGSDILTDRLAIGTVEDNA